MFVVFSKHRWSRDDGVNNTTSASHTYSATAGSRILAILTTGRTIHYTSDNCADDYYHDDDDDYHDDDDVSACLLNVPVSMIYWLYKLASVDSK